VRKADRAHSLSCRVTATNASGRAIATSAPVQVPAAVPGEPSVSLAAVPATTTAGQTVVLRGIVTSPGRARSVTIWRDKRGVAGQVAKVQLGAGGRFAWSVRLLSAGRWVYHAAHTSGGVTYTSDPVTVTVRRT
jgi:hypothetical protein